jgi:uncharacterized membrane protein YkvI
MLWLIDLAFFLLLAATVVGALWLSRKFKERYAEFPWWKAAVLIIAEVVAWVITHKFVAWIERHIWIVPIVVVVLIFILMKRKKKQEQVL